MATIDRKMTSEGPNENVSPEEKANVKWGLQAARYIIAHQNSGMAAFYNARNDYNRWRKYYLGKQDKNQYNPVLRIDPKSSRKEHLLSIRKDIKNYATNIINIVVSKINARKFDPVVDPKDPLAINQKKEFEYKTRTYLEQKEFLESIGLGAQAEAMKPNIPEELMPSNVTELDIYMQLDYKMEQAIKLEKSISETLEANRFYDITGRLYATDIAVCGAGAIFTGLDQNDKPLVRWIDPADMRLPYSKTGDWSNAKYMAHSEFMTLTDIKALNKTLSDDQLIEIEKNAHSNTGHSAFMDDAFRNDNHIEDVEKFEVIHFEYKTANEKVYLEKKDVGGNIRLHKKDFNYYNSETKLKEFNEKYKGERKIVRKRQQAIYSGYYIVGTDYIMNYGLKNNIEMPNGPFGQSVFGYKVFAPNYYDGEAISLMGQMEPVLDDLQEYSLKLREILAQPFPDGVMLDVHALVKAADSWSKGGKKMTPNDILEMAYQSKVLLFDGKAGKYEAGSNYKPMHSLGNGSQEIAKYLQLIGQSLMELQRITGLNDVTMAASLDKRAGKGTSEIQMQASEVALDHLYDAKKYLCQETYKSIGTLTLQSIKYGSNKGDIDRSVAKHTYDFIAEAQPTDYQWAEFYQDLAAMRETGLLTAADMATVRQIKNLKEARAYLAVAEAKKKKEAQQAQRENNEFNLRSQKETAQMSHQSKLQELNVKGQNDMQSKQLDFKLEAQRHNNKMSELEKQIELETNQKLLMQEQKAKFESKIAEEKEEESRETKMLLEQVKENK